MRVSAMSQAIVQPETVEILVAVDKELIEAVDKAVERFPGLDRTKVFDEALRMWYARELDAEAQYSEVESEEEAEEREIWRRIQAAAAERIFRAR
jgi:metal-responsive CopG/Arc/MetJ family transcriptional regulator